MISFMIGIAKLFILILAGDGGVVRRGGCI